MKIENAFKWPPCVYKSSQIPFINTSSIPWALLQTRWINLITNQWTIICGHTYKSVSANKRQIEQGRLICPQTPSAPPNSINRTKTTKENESRLSSQAGTPVSTPGLRAPVPESLGAQALHCGLLGSQTSGRYTTAPLLLQLHETSKALQRGEQIPTTNLTDYISLSHWLFPWTSLADVKGDMGDIIRFREITQLRNEV